jgi:hypothetical protein
MPQEVEKELLAADLQPEALNFHIAAVFFPTHINDSPLTTAVVFYSGGLQNHAVQVFRFRHGAWVLLDETDQVIGEAGVRVGAVDIDCDGDNEIVLSSSVGAAGLQSLEILKLEGDKLRVVTPRGRGRYLVGRSVAVVESEDGCQKELEVLLDGPVKYQPDRKLVYRLDRVNKTYELAEEIKLESSTQD